MPGKRPFDERRVLKWNDVIHRQGRMIEDYEEELKEEKEKNRHLIGQLSILKTSTIISPLPQKKKTLKEVPVLRFDSDDEEENKKENPKASSSKNGGNEEENSKATTSKNGGKEGENSKENKVKREKGKRIGHRERGRRQIERAKTKEIKKLKQLKKEQRELKKQQKELKKQKEMKKQQKKKK
ncbi:unnamed protein product [Meloidogyne enterolobii]|uniref:Uncharacterized protein n=1 Tax=Meloidogyne enterolobii TaxID=390850 RepID=A0ACB1AGG3_MELEN